MEILDLIHAKLNLARRVLRELVDHYEGMEDSERGDKSRTILDEINSYLQIEENLLFPYVRKQGQHEDLLARVRATHAEIEYVTDHLIHMHVDEPGGDYYNRLVRLAELLDLATRNDEEALFPWARVYLSEDDQLYIATHLKNQMIQESLPSSGMTIY